VSAQDPKRLHVNLFEMACVSHIVHGMWRAPGNRRHEFDRLSFWTDTATLAEEGLFDAVFLADVIGTYDKFGDSDDAALRQSVQIPTLDPLMLVPAMAAVTKNVGFGVTFSTTYEPPFAFARRMATLDHLTSGRVGWNIVTSYLRNAAQNFGYPDEVPHDDRYVKADEYLDVLYKLWEGSWDEDAIVRDVESDVYTSPDRVRRINHVGRDYSVTGPHLVHPSRQRTPVLFQASGSAAGLEFAGRHAEILFTGGRSTDEVRGNIHRAREHTIAHGRDGKDLRFVVMAGIIVARTDEEAERKYESYKKFFSVEAALVHAQAEVDLRRFRRDDTIATVLATEGKAFGNMARRFRPDQTIGSALDQISRFEDGRFFVVGSPTTVADAIERWLDVDGIDGINLRQYHSHDTARDFIEYVVPELQRRGRYRTSYTDGETLRARFFGDGNARLPLQHPASRYRDPGQLHIPPTPLSFATA